MRRYKYVSQIDLRDCGVAALASVAKHYGSDFSLAHLRELAKTTKEGTTALGIVEAAKTIGFETRAIQTNMELFDMADIPYPFIAHVNKEGKLQHYYVVYKAKKESLIIGDPDPSVGVINMSKERFAKEWTGVAIFLAPAPHYQPHKDKKNGLTSFLPIIFKQKALLTYIILASLLVTLINIVGSYYLQGILDDYIPNQLQSTLSIVSIGLMVTYIMQQIMSFSQNYLLVVLSQRLTIDVILAFMKSFERMNHDVMQANAMVNSAIIEDINGIETIKSLTSEEVRYQNIDREFVDYLDKSFTLSKYEAVQTSLKQGAQLIFNVAILWYGSRLVMSGNISVGELITYNTLLSYFTTPMENIINLQTKLQSAKVANNRLNEVYLVSSEFDGKQLLNDSHFLQGDIIFDDVSYKYGFGRDTLSHVNLHIKKGEKISLVGISGSGKTTLAKMIVNFYTPNHGQITLGGYDLKTIDKKAIRQYINYLPQQSYVFSGTILENLTLGAPDNITQEEILKACEIAEIRADIESMPMAYHTELSDGAGLSGGQKQRLALARALLTQAPVLILDEATSGLDVLTEKRVVKNLLSLTDKTIIFVAHRLSIAEQSDRIIVLDKGQVVEEGNHKQLIQNKSFYAQLFHE